MADWAFIQAIEGSDIFIMVAQSLVLSVIFGWKLHERILEIESEFLDKFHDGNLFDGTFRSKSSERFRLQNIVLFGVLKYFTCLFCTYLSILALVVGI